MYIPTNYLVCDRSSYVCVRVVRVGAHRCTAATGEVDIQAYPKDGEWLEIQEESIFNRSWCVRVS